MNLHRIHYISGLLITLFTAIHLINHAYSMLGADKHIEIMNMLRPYYRNVLVETVLLLAVCVQIVSGIKLFKIHRKSASSNFEKLHIWTGLYLAFFFIIHLGAVLVGRGILHLDTNFFFGVAGINTFPFSLFFIPYYALAIISFFGHIACIHNKKTKRTILGLTPNVQSTGILIGGIGITILIFYGLTNHFEGVSIPSEYNVLIGK